MSLAPRKGFNMARTFGSGALTGGLSQYPVASGYATALGTGDPVRLQTDGTIIQATNATGTLGVFMGCYYVDSTGRIQIQKYLPASQTAPTGTINVALVADDPRMTWTCTTSSPIDTVTMIPGALYPVNIVAPDSNIGHSKMTLNNTVSLTGSLDIHAQTDMTSVAGLENGDVFSVKSSVTGVNNTVTIITNMTTAQFLAALTGNGVVASLSGNFLNLKATDGGNLVLTNGTGTPLTDAPTLVAAAGTYTSTVALANAMVVVKQVLGATGANGISNPLQRTDSDVVEVAFVNNPFILDYI